MTKEELDWKLHDIIHAEGEYAHLKGKYEEKEETIKQLINQQVADEREIVRVELYQINWIHALSMAIKTRTTSFAKDPIIEWRNAADQVYGSFMIEAEQKGIFKSLKERAGLQENQEGPGEEEGK